MHSAEFLKGLLQPIVPKLLTENGPMYGYGTTQRVEGLSGGEILHTERALYPTLNQPEFDGLVVTGTVNIGRRIRKYDVLTPQGSTLAKEKGGVCADDKIHFVPITGPAL